MKAESNIAPALYSIDVYGDEAEVRLRENIVKLPVREDEKSDTTHWGYDEYVLTVRNRAGLAAEVKKNQALWLAVAKDGEYKVLAKNVRDKRDELLSICDWTQAADTPIYGAEKEQWKAYRQALRDIPQKAVFPWAVDWPEVPK
ncbi:MAG: tail fiber assembly protein [Bacteroides sp.]